MTTPIIFISHELTGSQSQATSTDWLPQLHDKVFFISCRSICIDKNCMPIQSFRHRYTHDCAWIWYYHLCVQKVYIEDTQRDFVVSRLIKDCCFQQLCLTITGSLKESMENGLPCFPAYGCATDWTVCYQDPTAPLETKPDPAAMCAEISSLVAGGYGGKSPPSGGWQPTPLGGWMKSKGTCSCGWGSTYV